MNAPTPHRTSHLHFPALSTRGLAVAVAAVLLLAVCQRAKAEYPPVVPVPTPIYGQPVEVSGGATVQGEYFRGIGRMLEGIGRGAHETAQGQFIAEQVQAVRLQNRATELANIAARREEEEQDRADRRQKRLGERARESSELAAAPGLAIPYQIDPATGRVEWPNVLTAPECATATTAVEDLLARWIEGKLWLADGDRLRLNQAVGRLRQHLRQQTGQVDTAQYVEATGLMDDIVEAAGTIRRARNGVVPGLADLR